MSAFTITKLWGFIQSLSLSAGNERWLAERLLESAKTKEITTTDKLAAFEKSFGVWASDPEADYMENIIKEGRKTNNLRTPVSFDD